MPPFGPIKRKNLIRFLKKSGFSGPFSGSRHQFMLKDDITIRLPNTHGGDVGKELLARILRQAHISKEEWEIL